MVSVIIPAYNCQDTLPRALRSLLAQTYSDFEVIIINDGSSDKTKEVATGFLDDGRIRLYTTENRGVSVARNYGIELAKGSHICFVDSDDYVESGYIDSLAANIGDGVMPCIGFAVNDSSRSETPSLPADEYLIGDSLMEDYLYGVLHETVAHAVWNKLFSADIIRDNRLSFNESLSVGEDLLFVLRYLCYCKKICFNNLPMYHYSILRTSAMRSDKRSLLEDYDRLLGKLKDTSYKGNAPDDETLSCWALESMSFALLSGYATSLRYRDFCGYCEKVFSSELYRYAVRCDMECRYKRRVFRCALRSRNKLFLYIILKAAR